MATSNTTTNPCAKRKRNEVSYNVDDYFGTMELDAAEIELNIESDDDGTFGASGEGRKPPKKRTKIAPKTLKTLKKEQIFPFMGLPAELQNQIYELALTDPNGVALVAKTKGYRRTVTRGVFTTEHDAHYYGRRRRTAAGYWSYYNRRQRDDSQDEDVGKDISRKLTPNLLAVSKKVREEASSILYKQEIVIEDTTALHVFIAQIGSYNRQLLSDITIKGWGKGRGVHKGHNFAALTILAECPNIESLFLDCSLGYHLDPIRLARQLFRDGHYFMEAFGIANGRYDAAIDVLELADWHFENRNHYGRVAANADSQEPEVDPKKKQRFENELRNLLKR